MHFVPLFDTARCMHARPLSLSHPLPSNVYLYAQTPISLSVLFRFKLNLKLEFDSGQERHCRASTRVIFDFHCLLDSGVLSSWSSRRCSAVLIEAVAFKEIGEGFRKLGFFS